MDRTVGSQVKAERHFIRIYDDDLRRDYPAIWADDRALATFSRLLSVADKMWPTNPELPRSVKPGPLASLARCGLIVRHDDGTYSVRGLNAERSKRAALASAAAHARWSADGTADSTASAMPTRQDKTPDQSKPIARDLDDDGRADLEAFLLLKRRAPTAKQRALLDEVMQRHDQTGPAWAADLMLKHPDDPIGAVIEADKVWRAERIAQAQAAEAPKPKPKRSGSGLTGINAELARYYRDLEAERKSKVDDSAA